MADTEPKTDEVLEQKQEEPKVESTDAAEAPATTEPASGDADSSTSGDAEADTAKPAEAEAGADEVAAEGDDSYQRYSYNRRRQEDRPRYEGVVRWFRADKGNYGFIEVESEELGNPDAHVHGDNVELDSEGNMQILEEGQRCSFTILARPPPKSDPTGETKYTAKEVIPGKKAVRVKKIVTKYKGRCVFFNHAKDKKFGFIKIEPCDDYPGGIDVYVHSDSVQGTKGKGLVEEQEVVCEIQKNEFPKGDTGETEVRLRAVNVKPGKAPPEDPEKDMWFSGSVVRWIERFEKDATTGKEINKSFGFIRLEKDSEREVMVHNSKLLAGDKLTVTQKCRFKIQKRKDRNNPNAKPRESAIEVTPGDVPVKKTLTGIVRFFDAEKGFGFIQRQGHADKDYYCRVEAIIGPDKELEEKQTVTFVAAPSNRPGKPRAVDVRPGKKAVNGEVAELAPEETPFEAYLPAHTGAVEKKAVKKSNLPKHIQIQQDNTMSEKEKAAALKKDFNYRKRMRRKRAMNRSDSGDSDEDQNEEALTPPPQKKKAPAPKPVPAPEPVQQQQKSTSSKKKKSKAAAPAPEPEQQPKKQKKQKQQQQPQQQPAQEAAAPVQTNSKKKKASKKASSPSSGDNNSSQKKQKQEEQAPLQTNKKKPKRKNNKNSSGASKRKAKADKQKQEEDDAIDALFEANKAARESKNASSASFFSMVYDYILSFCKTPAPKRKLKH